MVSLRPLTARSYKSKKNNYKINFIVPTTGKFAVKIYIKERRLSKKKKKKKNKVETIGHSFLSVCTSGSVLFTPTH